MEWLSDPTVWAGLTMLVLLEIVLGIDNLIFIAILSDKLPPAQRDRARKVGLGLALGMRLALLTAISWVMSLTRPLLNLFGTELSGRALILIIGGLFLLVKAMLEMHARLTAGARPALVASTSYAAFWPLVAQIVLLDIVFSLDSVITAVGMVESVYVMMTAVVIAMAVMVAVAKPLTTYLMAHESLVILCLGFLVMVALALMAEGLGYHVPKSYLYAAIGFSALIETCNQIAARQRRSRATASEFVNRTPVTTLERTMIHNYLSLADRPVHTIMTARSAMIWLDTEADANAVLATVRVHPFREFPIATGPLGLCSGIVRREDIMAMHHGERIFDLSRITRPAATLLEGASILTALEQRKGVPMQMLLVVNPTGDVRGILTQTDLLNAIVGGVSVPRPPAHHKAMSRPISGAAALRPVRHA